MTYFDGGISEPIPIKKAIDDGCEKIVVTLTRPRDFEKKHKMPEKVYRKLLKEYPESARLLYVMVDRYNESVKYLKELEKEGRVLIISPDDCCGLNTLKRNKESIEKLYEKGYNDARRIKEFLEK